MTYTEDESLPAELLWLVSARRYDRRKRAERLAEWEAYQLHMARVHKQLCRERLSAVRRLRALRQQEDNDEKGTAA